MEVFVELLKQCDNAVLRMVNMSFQDETLLHDTAAWFTARGIERERLKFLPPLPLDAYRLSMHTLDFGLLSYPFAGATVAQDFVQNGVPFVTRFSDFSRSRDGFVILQRGGVHRELAVRDYDRYLEVALTYGQDIEYLRWFRKAVHDYAAHGTSDVLTSALEKTLAQLWRQQGGTIPWGTDRG